MAPKKLSSVKSNTRNDAVPGRIGRFVILRELGRGTIGAVYIGHDPVMDRDVAIKTFNPNLSASARLQHRQHFINEARAAGRLSHPHIVTILEASNEAPDNYLAMELLEGRDLGTLLADGHTFSAEDVATLIWKLSDALDYAHKQQVIHRDIKPANIFLVNDHQPKLVDFGIARAPNRTAVQQNSDDAPFTLFRNNLLGTPNYMSPEQASGNAVDHRTDIYSLGAVMYEMLTGSRPFQSRDTNKLLQMISAKTPPSPREVNRSVPTALSKIVVKAMSKQADQRYQHASDMTLELRRYLLDGRRARHHLRLSNHASARADTQSKRQRYTLLAGGIVLVGMLLLGLLMEWRV